MDSMVPFFYLCLTVLFGTVENNEMTNFQFSNKPLTIEQDNSTTENPTSTSKLKADHQFQSNLIELDLNQSKQNEFTILSDPNQRNIINKKLPLQDELVIKEFHFANQTNNHQINVINHSRTLSKTIKTQSQNNNEILINDAERVNNMPIDKKLFELSTKPSQLTTATSNKLFINNKTETPNRKAITSEPIIPLNIKLNNKIKIKNNVLNNSITTVKNKNIFDTRIPLRTESKVDQFIETLKITDVFTPVYVASDKRIVNIQTYREDTRKNSSAPITAPTPTKIIGTSTTPSINNRELLNILHIKNGINFQTTTHRDEVIKTSTTPMENIATFSTPPMLLTPSTNSGVHESDITDPLSVYLFNISDIGDDLISTNTNTNDTTLLVDYMDIYGSDMPPYLYSSVTSDTLSTGDVTSALTSNGDDNSQQWPVKHSAVVEGDIILGGLMMVHEREDSITCGPIMPQGGIQALEAMLYTLDRLNEDPTFLPNVTIGAHILDDCDKDTYGLEMAVDFIKDSLKECDDELFSIKLYFLYEGKPETVKCTCRKCDKNSKWFNNCHMKKAVIDKALADCKK